MTATTTKRTINTVEQAIDRYMAVIGPAAMKPRRKQCSVTKNGIYILRNATGHLAIVTRYGAVQTRIGGAVLAQAFGGEE